MQLVISDLQDPRVLKEKLDLQDPRAVLDLPVQIQLLQDQQVLQDPRDLLDLQALQDQQGQPVKLARQVFKAS